MLCVFRRHAIRSTVRKAIVCICVTVVDVDDFFNVWSDLDGFIKVIRVLCRTNQEDVASECEQRPFDDEEDNVPRCEVRVEPKCK